MANEKILLVEDEEGIRELIQLYLNNKGYKVIQAENGDQALEILTTANPLLILLDIEMPGIDGFDVCRKIRQNSDVPIIFVSSRRDVMDKLKCFELGGDDYITKPFNFDELEARVNANLRRYKRLKKQISKKMLTFGNLEIHLDSYECFLNGKRVMLSTKEMQMLIMLAKRPNHVFSAEQIYDQVWGLDSVGDPQTIKVHIRNLRRKIEEDAANPKFIITARGFGYRFAY